MNEDKLERLKKLRDNSVLTESEYQLEKDRLLNVQPTSQINSDFAKISSAGVNLLNIFSSIIFIIIANIITAIVYNIYFESDRYDRKFEQILIITTAIIQLGVLVVLLYNLYQAGWKLKHSFTTIVNSKQVTMSEIHKESEIQDFVTKLRNEKGLNGKSIDIENHCPACNFEFEADINYLNIEKCPSCGLYF